MNTEPKAPEVFDLEAVYDEQIAPLMSQIIAVCKAHRLPMIASFNYRSTEDAHDTCDTLLAFEERDAPDYPRALATIRGGARLLAFTIRSGG